MCTTISYSQIPTAEEYREARLLMWSDAMYCDSVLASMPTPIFSNSPITYETVLDIPARNDRNTGLDKILIIANSQIYAEVKNKIDRYAGDVNRTYFCQVKVISVSGGNHTDIKDIILADSNDLNGVVFIGDIPTAYYQIPSNVWPDVMVNFQCELYYMDLDGDWEDNINNDGIYDRHTGDVKPEIFVGRISTAHMENWFTEKEGLENYLDKLHNFYIHCWNSINNKYALTYIDSDWIGHYDICHGIRALYGNNNYNYDHVNSDSVGYGKTDYLNNRLNNSRYEFIQLAAHSYYTHHKIIKNDTNHTAHPIDISNSGTKAIAYNLYCCSACVWPTQNSGNNLNIGTSYIYNNSPHSLTVVGSTKTGSMKRFYSFYYQLGLGKVIGESLLKWWQIFGNNHNTDIIDFHYGMCILGDPMVSMYQNNYARIDLHVKDTEEDIGEEPNPNNRPENYWISDDIWVRHMNDNLTTHQNPEYDPIYPNYVKVRVRNIGTTENVGDEKIELYWTKSSTNFDWPHAWSSSNFVVNPNTGDTIQCGGMIGSLSIPVIQPGEEAIVTFTWNVPNPEDYTFVFNEPSQFAFLARINAPYDPMTYPETSNTLLNIKNNNNIACKNVTVVDVVSNEVSYYGGSTSIRNPKNRATPFRVLFHTNDSVPGEEIFNHAEISITLDSTLLNGWILGGMQSANLSNTNNNNKKIVNNNNAALYNIILNPYEVGVIDISYNFLTKHINGTAKQYKYHITQKEENTDDITGGLTYIINKDIRDPFYANANLIEGGSNQQSKLIAQNINEPAIYNWYNTQGELIHTGEELYIPNNISNTYKLEVISEVDGYKDYENIAVFENSGQINSINPNPATNSINVGYQLTNVNSAHIAIVDLYTGSSSNNYIIDVNLNNIDINIANYPQGIYLVYLVCDGQVKDSKQFIKQ